MASYKALIFLFVAIFAVAFAAEEARGKRGVFYGGYGYNGAAPYSAGYAAYPTAYSAGYGLGYTGYSGYAGYPYGYSGYSGYSGYPYGAVSYVH
nr:prisilkin-39-like [Halyomorpha halys]